MAGARRTASQRDTRLFRAYCDGCGRQLLDSALPLRLAAIAAQTHAARARHVSRVEPEREFYAVAVFRPPDPGP